MGKLVLSVLVLIVILSACSGVKEEDEKKPKQIFKEFRIYLNQSDLDGIFENPHPNTYIPITIKSDGDTALSAKMRIRGDSSRDYDKKSLKIVFEKGAKRLVGEGRKINLNSEWTDKSYIRQYLSAHLMAEAGVNTYNTNFVKLFVNDKFFGLYLQVENMDKEFLKTRGIDPKGNMYKATKDGACLSVFDNVKKLWEKKSNKGTDWEDLNELITTLDTISSENVYAFLTNNFEYDQLITVVAMNMLIQNSSTYYHNYYMYHDIYGNNRWQVFPWDMDKSMSYYSWKPYVYDETANKWLSDNVLVERVLLDDQAFNDVIKKVEDLGKTVFNSKSLDPIIDTLGILLEESVRQDTSDQINDVKQWKEYLQKEKNFVTQQVNYITNQLKTFPRGFLLHKFKNTQIVPPVLKWEPSKSPIGKAISYKVFFSKDYLFEQEGTVVVENITETSFQIPESIKEGKYFWKIQATDGDHTIDGHNTRNIFDYKKPTTIKTNIYRSTTWKKEKSPYYLVKDLTIANGATLTIEKGTDIILKEDVNIYVKGQVMINGEKGQEVVFRPEKKQWGEIHLYGKNNRNEISYTVFKEGVFRSSGTDVNLFNTTIQVMKKNLLYDGYRQAVVWVKNGKFTMNFCKLYSNGTGEGMNINFAESEIMNSYFNNAPDAIELMNVTSGKIYNNYVENSPDDAIDLNGCKNVVVFRNYLINNNDKAVSVGTEEYGPSNNIVVKQNLIINNGTAISVKDSSDVLVKNNTIINTNKGIKAYLKNNKKQYLIGGKAIVENTIFNSTNNGVIEFDKNSEIQVSYSIAENTKIKGKGNIVGSPGFINPERGNYYLLPTSYCVNSGKENRNMGRYLKGDYFLTITKQDSFYVLKNSNIFNVDLSGYSIKIDDQESEYLPRYFLEGEEEIILTNKPKKLQINGRIVKVNGLDKKSKRIILFDNNKKIIFTLNIG